MKIVQQSILIETSPRELEELVMVLYSVGLRDVKALSKLEKRLDELGRDFMDRDRRAKSEEWTIAEISSKKKYLKMVYRQLKKLDVKKCQKILRDLKEYRLNDLHDGLLGDKVELV